MDRATRNQYRKVVEELALATGQSELEVARMANTLAQAAWTNPPAALEPVDGEGQADAAAWPGLDMPPAAHVGYYLLDDGRAALEDRLGYRPSPGASLARSARRHPAVVYLGPIALLTLLMLAAAAVYAAAQGGSAFSAAPGRCAGLPAGAGGRGGPGRLGCHPGCATPDSAQAQSLRGTRRAMGYPTHAAHWWWCRRC